MQKVFATSSPQNFVLEQEYVSHPEISFPLVGYLKTTTMAPLLPCLDSSPSMQQVMEMPLGLSLVDHHWNSHHHNCYCSYSNYHFPPMDLIPRYSRHFLYPLIQLHDEAFVELLNIVVDAMVEEVVVLDDNSNDEVRVNQIVLVASCCLNSPHCPLHLLRLRPTENPYNSVIHCHNYCVQVHHYHHIHIHNHVDCDVVMNIEMHYYSPACCVD